jgi:lipid II:glycine glycyltransferase (peptidoglycan interpeptide bridge formation enzyme)
LTGNATIKINAIARRLAEHGTRDNLAATLVLVAAVQAQAQVQNLVLATIAVALTATQATMALAASLYKARLLIPAHALQNTVPAAAIRLQLAKK